MKINQSQSQQNKADRKADPFINAQSNKSTFFPAIKWYVFIFP